jgi:hypothetical protein
MMINSIPCCTLFAIFKVALHWLLGVFIMTFPEDHAISLDGKQDRHYDRKDQEEEAGEELSSVPTCDDLDWAAAGASAVMLTKEHSDSDANEADDGIPTTFDGKELTELKGAAATAVITKAPEDALTMALYQPGIHALHISNTTTRLDDIKLKAILGNPVHRDFYLSMMQMLRSAMAACQALGSGLVKPKRGFRRTVLNMVAEALALLPGAAAAGAIVAKLLTAKEDTDQRRRASRVCLFVALAGEKQGGIDTVLKQTARLILRYCHKQGFLNESEAQAFGWFKRMYRQAQGSLVDTKAKEKGINAAERTLNTIMDPKKSGVLWSILECQDFETPMHEALAAAALDMSLDSVRALERYRPDEALAL